jgi:hypothetical protein
VTDKAQTVTDDCEGRLDQMARRHKRDCEFCRRPILFMRTYLGESYPFDAEAVSRRLDAFRDGWVPGAWLVGGRSRCLMAPVHMYPADKQARVEHVLLMHRCPGRRPRAAAPTREMAMA